LRENDNIEDHYHIDITKEIMKSIELSIDMNIYINIKDLNINDDEKYDMIYKDENIFFSYFIKSELNTSLRSSMRFII
jgi:hypothetical protein